jgi:hypothetical protein
MHFEAHPFSSRNRDFCQALGNNYDCLYYSTRKNYRTSSVPLWIVNDPLLIAIPPLMMVFPVIDV